VISVDDIFPPLAGSLEINDRRADAGVFVIDRLPRHNRHVGNSGHGRLRERRRLGRKPAEQTVPQVRNDFGQIP
jgi:hypothetical protein